MYARRASEYSSHMSSTDERESPEKTIIEEADEDSLGNGQPHPPTEMFKGMDLFRSDTPETYLSDIPDKPDITLFCEECRLFIDMRQLKRHRSYHSALQILNYKGNFLPESSEQLLKKRNAVLRKMKKEATLEKPIEPKHIQQVNDAYEMLKSELEDTFEACRQVKEIVDTSCQATALNCSPQCIYAVGMCSSANSRWKSEMEDTKVYQDSFGENIKKCYLGLFDGYHGRFSAEVAASLLHKMLLHELMKFDNSLKQGPSLDYDGNADISHHSFVFGAGASLDGQVGKDERSTADKGTTGKDKETATVIQLDDDELTERIIQLCESKYDKLLEELSPTPKSSRANSKRSKHLMEEKILQAFDKSYQLLDILLSYGKDEWSNVRWSGCSALSLIVESADEQGEEEPQQSSQNAGDKSKRKSSRMPDPPKELGFIHLANAGDARALLVRGNKIHRISKDHTPSNRKERERVLRAGGALNSSEADCRVNGVLGTTRGLGNHGDPALKACVLVEPHTVSVPIDRYAQFLVLATAGVWEVLSDQEVGSLLMRLLPSNQIPPPMNPSSTLDELLNQDVDTGCELRTDSPQDKPDPGEGINEKGSKDAGVSEKVSDEMDKGEERLRIAADLKTEAGSVLGDGEDAAVVMMGEQDLVSLPVHSTLELGGRGTVEERRRDLARSMAQYIVQAALLAGSRNNITVMVALLPGCQV